MLLMANVVLAKSEAGTISIQIKAVVLPFTSILSIREPALILVTTEDIRKGYVDERAPLLVEIRTNSRKGCVLTFNASESPFRETEVMLLDRTVLVGRQGGMILIEGFGRKAMLFHYRFKLEPGTQPGTYPWPFAISVDPR